MFNNFIKYNITRLVFIEIIYNFKIKFFLNMFNKKFIIMTENVIINGFKKIFRSFLFNEII